MYKINPLYRPVLFGIDTIGSLFFFWKKFKPFPKKIRKILVIRLDHIGDMLLTTPVFKTLKNNFPDAEVHVLSRTIAVPILEGNSSVDKIIEFNAPWFARGERIDNKNELINKLKKERYDLVLELKGDPRNILFANSIGSYSVGYSIRGFGFLLNKVVSWKGIKHISERYLDLLRAIGCKRISQKLELFIDKKTKEKVIKMLPSGHKMCINPGVGAVERQWPLENFAELINKIDSRIILVDSDKSRTSKILKLVKDKQKVIDLSGKLNIKELAEAVKQCNLFIGLESATMHIASAVGTPLIDIHSGVTYTKEWGPYQGKHIVLQKFVGLYTSKEKAIKAISSITPDKVIEAIRELK